MLTEFELIRTLMLGPTAETADWIDVLLAEPHHYNALRRAFCSLTQQQKKDIRVILTKVAVNLGKALPEWTR